MKGTPEPEVHNLRQLLLEQQALLAVTDARFRGLRHFVLEICRLANIRDVAAGRPLEDVLKDVIDTELDAKLARISDDDPRHAAYLKQIITAAKTNRA